MHLTKRELDVAGLIAEGYLNYEIVNRLGISANTLKIHITNIRKKIGAKRRSDIAVWINQNYPNRQIA